MAQELVGRVHADHLGVQLAHKHVHDHVALVQAQQAVVDEHAGELVADGAVDQRRSHRRIDPAGQAENHLFVAHLLADLLHRFFNVVAHHPVGPGGADVEHKALQHGPALHRVGDLGVKLHGVEVPCLVGHAGDGATVGAGHELEAWRQLGDLVAVAHPHLEHAVAFRRGEVGNVFQQRGVAAGAHLGIAELARVRALDLAAELLRHGLHAVANAQHRNAELVHRIGCLVVYLVHAGVAAGEDHALELTVGGELAHPVAAHVARMHFAVHVGLAHAACNQLGDLGTEIEDEDFLVQHGVSGWAVQKAKRPSIRTAAGAGLFTPRGSWVPLW